MKIVMSLILMAFISTVSFAQVPSQQNPQVQQQKTPQLPSCNNGVLDCQANVTLQKDNIQIGQDQLVVAADQTKMQNDYNSYVIAKQQANLTSSQAALATLESANQPNTGTGTGTGT